MQKNKGRTFQETWCKDFLWITVCTTRNKAFCYTCREANKQRFLSFSKYADVAFITSGFNNWKKSLEKFRKHEPSEAHKKAVLKLSCKKRAQGIDVMILSQHATLQATRRAGPLKQITSLRFLLRQIIIRGHTEDEGNLSQLLKLRTEDSDTVQA